MFERRLKIVLMIPILCGIILITRLYQLQIVNGAAYQQKADEALLAPRQFLPPLRGRILDRFGRFLVSDEPASDLTIHYAVLSMNADYLQRLAAHMKPVVPGNRSTSPSENIAEIKRRIAMMWTILQQESALPMRELRRRCERICQSVENLRRYIWNARRRRGSDESIEKIRLREEGMFHPILRDISPQLRTRLEMELANLPFVRIEPSVRRVWSKEAQPFCHILGSLGQVTPRRIKNDPRKDDRLGCYRAGDRAGISGVEFLAEAMLRGKRGYEEKNLDGGINFFQAPIDGLDVQLTIDLDLQNHIADLLKTAVEKHPPSTGASCVVMDIESREILAMVSVPTFTRDQFQHHYSTLRDDAKHRPLLFRAVREEYQPGSIVKPMTLLAGFQNGLVDPARTVFCNGSFIPGSDKWHCWTFWRGLPGHGQVTAEEAIQHSCNVYFFDLGQRLNAMRLTAFDRRFVLGPAHAGRYSPSTGLIEESDGIIPTRAWMKQHRHRGFRPADGRNYAIGQGEMQLTPLQITNLYATVATGFYRDPTIIANDLRSRPKQIIAGPSEEAWETARHGLYRCVNEPGGTAYKYARLESLEVCGKTGSAQCVARVTEQRFTFIAKTSPPGKKSPSSRKQSNAREKQVNAGIPGGDAKQMTHDQPTLWAVAPTVENARELLDLPTSAECVKREVLQRWPPNRPEKNSPPTHAWYAAYAPYRHPKIALAVIVEYGGSGGHTAAPVGKAIFQALLQSPHAYLLQEPEKPLAQSP